MKINNKDSEKHKKVHSLLYPYPSIPQTFLLLLFRRRRQWKTWHEYGNRQNFQYPDRHENSQEGMKMCCRKATTEKTPIKLGLLKESKLNFQSIIKTEAQK